MIVLRIVIGISKALIVLGLIEYVAPGLSYQASKYIVGMMMGG